MKKIILVIILLIVLLTALVCLTGCTLKIETTDNSVSASVDGETTAKVDSIIDWIKDRLSRVFVTSGAKETVTKANI